MKRNWIYAAVFITVLTVFGGFAADNALTVGKVYVVPNPARRSKKACRIVVNITEAPLTDSRSVTLIIVNKKNQKVWSKKINIFQKGKNEYQWGFTNDLGQAVTPGVYYCKIYIADDKTHYQTVKILVQ